MRRLSIALYVLGATCRTAIPAELIAHASPLRDLPSGWVQLSGHLDTDAWAGEYHDRESGAFVTYFFMAMAHGWPEEFEKHEPGDTLTSGVLEGIPFKALWEADGRKHALRTWKELYDETLPEAGSWERAFVDANTPPPGASRLTVSFLPRDEHFPMSFHADVCDDAQRSRVTELLLDRMRLRLDARGDLPKKKRRALSLQKYESLKPGSSYQKVVGALNCEFGVWRDWPEGFLLNYAEDGDGSFQLVFGKDQRLRAKRQVRYRETKYP